MKTIAMIPAALLGTGSGQTKQLIGQIRLALSILLMLCLLGPSTSSGASSPTLTADQSSGDNQQQQQQDADNLAELLPNTDSLFKPNQLEPDELDAVDCHMRNMDLCYAGLLSSSSKPMPTSDAELEARCDEVRLTASCLAIFNKRCHTFKVFSLLGPATQVERMVRLKSSDGAANVVTQIDAGSGKPTNKLPTLPNVEQLAAGNLSMEQSLSTIADLQTLCDPASAKLLPGAAKSVRQNFFRIANCINERATSIRPCVEDLKTAIQLFFEPQRKLPLNATCCAMTRFRDCSTKAVDNLCGFGSYEQLEKILATATGSSTQLFSRTMNRMCRKSIGSNQDFCADVLPPSGMQIAERRGRKASKLAKILGLFSMGTSPDVARL